MEQKMGRRLVLFPLPWVGHQNPIFELGNILHSRGFSVSVIHTQFRSPNPAKYPQFNFYFIDDGLLESEVPLATANTLNQNCVEPFKACLSQIISNGSDQEPVPCLLTDVMWFFSQAVADDLKVPRIVLRPGNMSSFTVFSIHIDLKDKQPEDFVSELPHIRVKDIPKAGKGEESLFQDFLSNTVKASKASKGLLFNTLEEIEDRSLTILQQEFPVPIFPIGPFYKCFPSPSSSLPAQDQRPLSWLDTQAPSSVLYVSFGTIAVIDHAAFLEMAWGLANSGQPFLWVIRSDLVQSSSETSKLPDGFMEKVSGRSHFVSWAPQKEVLAHPAVGGFWTHNGWNSTLESICEGVPMICSPCFGDQMVNARYVSDVWKIGLLLETEAKTEDAVKAIRTLMVEKEGEEIRERAAYFKNKASSCVQPGGSSFNHMADLVNLIMSF